MRLTAGYSLGSFAGPIFTILLTPVYTRLLHPDDYAVLDMATTLGILTLAIGTLGLPGAVNVFFHDGDAAHGRRVISTAAAVGVGWSALVALVLALVARPLAAFSFSDARLAVLLYLTAINLPFAVLYGIIQAGLRLRLAVRRANTLALAYIAGTIGLNLLFVVVLRWGVLGVQSAIVIVTLALTIAGVALTRHDIWARPSWALARPLVRAGLPFVPASLSFWALAYLDRLILPAYAVALDSRGLYAIANKLASMLAIIIVPFQNAWGPLALAMRDDPGAPRTYAKVLTYFTVAALGLALMVGLFAREILLIFTTPEYIAAAPYVGPLAYVAVANGAAVAISVGVYLIRRTDLIGWTTLIGAAVNLLLNVLLIPRFGVWGAVWATTLGYAAAPVALYIAVQRVHPLPFELPKIFVALVAQVVLLLAGTLIRTSDPWLDVAAKLLLPLAYAGALVLLRVLEPYELRALLRLIGRQRALLTAMVRR
ncbi:MAG: lipopolysaccharide biosynthesis protein [Roseiflexaceae bacterium]